MGGGCSILIVRNGEFCRVPASSVLFDGVIPIINNSTTWAGQLLTFNTTSDSLSITFIFMPPTSVNGTRIPFTGVSGIEVVMFNCPTIYHARTTSIVFKDNREGGILEHISTDNYTDHVIRICTSDNFYTSSNEIIIEFVRQPGVPVYLLYLAEVTFYSSHNNHCTVGSITTSTILRSTSTTTSTTNNISKLMYVVFRYP